MSVGEGVFVSEVQAFKPRASFRASLQAKANEGLAIRFQI